MATKPHTVPTDIEHKLDVARWRLRVAKTTDNLAWQAQVLQEIDELLDQLPKGSP